MAATVAESDSYIQALIKDPTVSYLKVLVQPQNPKIDIVAVHGLNVSIPGMKTEAFGVNTWVAEDSDNKEHVNHKTLWLKDFLPDRCPYARVMLFGYNSSVGTKTSTAGVAGAADDLLARLTHTRRDVHDRPILFLCHSLGGIVVKLAVSKARSSPQHQDLYPQMRSIAFFATPHRGGLFAKFGQVAAGGLRRISGNVRSSIMECLRADSLISPEIHRSFRDCLSDDNIHICSFYEAKPISPLPWLVVEQNSAVLGLEFPKEAQYLVPESNHSSICKFKSKDQNYEVIEDHLDDLIKYSLGENTSKHEPWMERISLSKISSRSSIVEDDDLDSTRQVSSYLNIMDGMQRSPSPLGFKEQTQGSGPWFIRPNVGISKFTGREVLLELIQQDLTQANSSQNRVAIHGLGGVGKTQIALKIIEWYQNTYPSDSVYWLRAGSSAVFFESLEDIATTCHLSRIRDNESSTLASVQQHLLDDRHKWLIVVDNADNCDTLPNPLPYYSRLAGTSKNFHRMPMATMIPRCAHGRVLFTTKSKAVASQLAAPDGQMIEITPMSPQESKELLQRQLYDTAHSGANPPSYQQSLPSDQDVEDLATNLGNLPLAITQATAYMQVQNLTVSDYLSHIAQDDVSLSDLLNYNFQGIEDDFSKAVASTWKAAFDRIELDCPTASEMLSFMAFLEPQSIPKALLKQVQPDERQLTAISLGTLHAYALVTIGPGSETYAMHRLVQIAMINRLKGTPALKAYASKALAALVKSFPQKEDTPSSERSRLLPHALQVLKNDFTDSDEDRILASTLASNISHYYRCQGNYSGALTQSKMAKDYLGKLVKAPKALVLSNQATEVLALRESGYITEALELANIVWLEQKKEHGLKADITVRSHLDVGLLYQDLGRYKESHRIAKDCLKIVQKTHEEQDMLLLRAKLRYGRILHYTGDYAESEKILTETLGPVTRVLGSQHPETIKIKYQIAFTVLALGRFSESENMCSETWADQKLVLGEEHPSTLKTLNLKANALLGLGEYDSALRIHRKIYSEAVKRLGPNHRYSYLAAASLADTLSVLKDNNMPSTKALEEAETLYRRILDGSSAPDGTTQNSMLSIQTNLANILRLQGKSEEAEKLQRETCKKLKGAFGKEHPVTLDAYENLARCLKDTGKEKDATKKATKVLERREKVLGWSNIATVRVAKLIIELSPDHKGNEKIRSKITKVESEQDLSVEPPRYDDYEVRAEVQHVKRKPVVWSGSDSKDGWEKDDHVV